MITNDKGLGQRTRPNAPVEMLHPRRRRLSGWKTVGPDGSTTLAYPDQSTRSSTTATTLGGSLDGVSSSTNSPMSSSNGSLSNSHQKGRPLSLPKIDDSHREEEDTTRIRRISEEENEDTKTSSTDNVGMEGSIGLNDPDPSIGENPIEVTLENGLVADLYDEEAEIDPYSSQSIGLDFSYGIEGQVHYYSSHEEDTSASSEASGVRGYYTEETASRGTDSSFSTSLEEPSINPSEADNSFLQTQSAKATNIIPSREEEESFDSIGSDLQQRSWKWQDDDEEEISFGTYLSESQHSLSTWNTRSTNTFSTATTNSSWGQISATPSRWSAQLPLHHHSRLGDLSEWTSEEESSSEEEDDPTDSEPKVHEPTPSHHPKPPGSAYNKNAPWYCGEDPSEEASSLEESSSSNSDSSSVLSHLKKKSKTKSQASNQPQDPRKKQSASDGSLSFHQLAQPVSHSDLEAPSDGSLSFHQLAQPVSLSDLEAPSDGSLSFPFPFRQLAQPLSHSDLESGGDEGDSHHGFPIQTRPMTKPISDLSSVGGPFDPAKRENLEPKICFQAPNIIEAGPYESEDEETGPSSADEAPALDVKEKGLLQEILDSKWTRWTVYSCSALFLLFDICLVIALIATR